MYGETRAVDRLGGARIVSGAVTVPVHRDADYLIYYYYYFIHRAAQCDRYYREIVKSRGQATSNRFSGEYLKTTSCIQGDSPWTYTPFSHSILYFKCEFWNFKYSILLYYTYNTFTYTNLYYWRNAALWNAIIHFRIMKILIKSPSPQPFIL